MKNTIENNILLAEFLGWKRETVVRGSKNRIYDFICPEHIEVIGESDSHYCSDCGRDTYRKKYLFGEDLLFHKSWDWLMKVVDKIESLGFEFIQKNWQTKIINSHTGEYILIHTNKNRLLHTYKACIQFVKWFNSQNK